MRLSADWFFFLIGTRNRSRRLTPDQLCLSDSNVFELLGTTLKLISEQCSVYKEGRKFRSGAVIVYILAKLKVNVGSIFYFILFYCFYLSIVSFILLLTFYCVMYLLCFIFFFKFSSFIVIILRVRQQYNEI